MDSCLSLFSPIAKHAEPTDESSRTDRYRHHLVTVCMHGAHGPQLPLDQAPYSDFSTHEGYLGCNEPELEARLQALASQQAGGSERVGATVVVGCGIEQPPPPAAASVEALVGRIRRLAGPTAFIVLWHPLAVEDPAMRIAAFKAGVNMVRCGAPCVKPLFIHGRQCAAVGKWGNVPHGTQSTMLWRRFAMEARGMAHLAICWPLSLVCLMFVDT